MKCKEKNNTDSIYKLPYRGERYLGSVLIQNYYFINHNNCYRFSCLFVCNGLMLLYCVGFSLPGTAAKSESLKHVMSHRDHPVVRFLSPVNRAAMIVRIISNGSHSPHNAVTNRPYNIPSPFRFQWWSWVELVLLGQRCNQLRLSMQSVLVTA